MGGTGWWIELEPEIHFPIGRLAVPDLAGWRIDRVPQLPDDNPIAILPDWCCEVLSHSTARDDKKLKLPLYATAGVQWSWLVDPVLRLVEVYEAVGGFPTLRMTAVDNHGSSILPFEHEISLEHWWITVPA